MELPLKYSVETNTIFCDEHFCLSVPRFLLAVCDGLATCGDGVLRDFRLPTHHPHMIRIIFT